MLCVSQFKFDRASIVYRRSILIRVFVQSSPSRRACEYVHAVVIRHFGLDYAVYVVWFMRWLNAFLVSTTLYTALDPLTKIDPLFYRVLRCILVPVFFLRSINFIVPYFTYVPVYEFP